MHWTWGSPRGRGHEDKTPTKGTGKESPEKQEENQRTLEPRESRRKPSTEEQTTRIKRCREIKSEEN